MSAGLVISQEFIKFDSKQKLTPILLEYSKQLIETARNKRSDQAVADKLGELAKAVRKETGLLIHGWSYVLTPVVNAGMYSVDLGSSSPVSGNVSGGVAPLELDITDEKYAGKIHQSTIDLDQLKIKGGLLVEFPFQLQITKGLLTSGFSVEEVAAVIGHELGHAFGKLITIGETVWLNFYLQDGVDMLLGKKPDTLKVKTFTLDYIRKTVGDPKLEQELKENPTEENLRVAILAAHDKLPRPHLTGTVRGIERLRSEQTADWFVSRLGLGRYMVSALDRMGIAEGRYYRSRGQHVSIETIKWCLSIGLIGGTMGAVLPLYAIAGIAKFLSLSDTYDAPLDRLTKFRLDAIAQLKRLDRKDPMVAHITAEIAEIDRILAKYNNYRTLFETVSFITNPFMRRRKQHLVMEQRLEALLNNDLFLTAKKFNV